MLLNDGILESLVEANFDIFCLVLVAIGQGEFLVGEGVREHDTASVLADEVLLADLVFEVDHEESKETHDGVGKEPSAADGVTSTICGHSALGVILKVNLDAYQPDKGDGSRGTNEN